MSELKEMLNQLPLAEASGQIGREASGFSQN